MTNHERFATLQAYVKHIENTFSCPWVDNGAWFNTVFTGEIELNTPRGITITQNIDDIDSLLAKNNLQLVFGRERPRIELIRA